MELAGLFLLKMTSTGNCGLTLVTLTTFGTKLRFSNQTFLYLAF